MICELCGRVARKERLIRHQIGCPKRGDNTVDEFKIQEIIKGCKVIENSRNMYRLEIPPKVAEQWLEKYNTANRNMNNVNVSKMVQDIKNGEWGLTTDCIGFTSEGILANGQNRLKALVNAKKPLEFLVVFGLLKQDTKYMDSGTKRSIAQQMKMAGMFSDIPDKERNDYVKIAKMMIDPDSRVRNKFSRPQQMEFMIKYREAIKFSYDCFNKYKPAQRRRLDIAVVKACIALAYIKREDSEVLRTFVDRLITGDKISPKDETIFRLRDWLKDDRIADSTDGTVEARRKIEQYLKAWIDGRAVSFTKRIKTPFLPNVSIPIPKKIA